MDGERHAGRGEGWRRYWESQKPPGPAFEAESREFVRRLAGALPLEPSLRVFDFGSGFGFSARELAPQVREIVTWDAADSMRRYSRETLRGCANVRVLDRFDPAGAKDHGHFDRILVNSVLQYMSARETEAWVPAWASMLALGGGLVLSDLIPHRHSLVGEALDLARSHPRQFALGLGRRLWTYVRCLRHEPLQRVGVEEVEAWGRRLGLGVRVLPRSLTHLPRRTAVVLEAGAECASSA